jgi:transposase
MRWSIRKVCHCVSSFIRRASKIVMEPRSCSIRNSFPWLALLWADSGYNAHQVNAAVAKVPSLRIEIVKRSDDMKGFVLLPRRWVVERTFSWFGRNRRLAKDWENLAATLQAFVSLASIQIAIRRLAR